MEVWKEQGVDRHRHEYENYKDIPSREIQQCQESTTLHFLNFDSVGESRRERLQCLISYTLLFLERSLHGSH